MQLATATPNDRQELGDFLVNAFLTHGGEPFYFLDRLPHLFTDDRIGEHSIARENGKIIGCVGAYRFDLMHKGIAFDACGIGQVGTAPEARGKGVMQALMKAAIEKNADCDFFWLYGERRRYGYHGFELGGQYTEYCFTKRYLQKLVPAISPSINVSIKYDTILPKLQATSTYLELSPDERQYCFDGKALKVLSTDHAQIVYSGNEQFIHYAWGEKSHLAAIFLHVIETYREDDDVYHHVDEFEPTTHHTLLPHYTDATRETSANYRIGNLSTLLEKTAQLTPTKNYDLSQVLSILSPLTPLQQSIAIFSPFTSQLPQGAFEETIPTLSDLHIPRIYAL
ncbi:MAG: GNAT family N-acetyltransferase [Verrucomicrobiota bacterium]